MGFFNFLKAKKAQKNEEQLDTGQGFEQLPPLPLENELYSELPNLPEAPETPGLPELDLPQPLKGLGEFDFQEGIGEEAEKKMMPALPSAGDRQRQQPIEPLIPEWPKPAATKMPEMPAMVEHTNENPWGIPKEVPELNMPEPGPRQGEGGHSINKNNFFLRSEDFKMIVEDIDTIVRVQKKHHKLNGIKKDENAQYEHMSFLIEDAQRKLMHVDKTLFE